MGFGRANAFLPFGNLDDHLRRMKRSAADEMMYYSSQQPLQQRRRVASSQISSSSSALPPQSRYQQLLDEELNAFTSPGSTPRTTNTSNIPGVGSINYFSSSSVGRAGHHSPPFLANHTTSQLLGSSQQPSALLRPPSSNHHQTLGEQINLLSSSTMSNLPRRPFPFTANSSSTPTSAGAKSNLAFDPASAGISMQDGMLSLPGGLHDGLVNTDQMQKLRRLASTENDILTMADRRLLSYKHDQQRRLVHSNTTGLLSSDRTSSDSTATNSLLTDHQIILRRQLLLNERNQNSMLMTEALSNMVGGATANLGRPTPALSNNSSTNADVGNFSISSSLLEGTRGISHTQNNGIDSQHNQIGASMRNATNMRSEYSSLLSGPIESTRRYLNQSYGEARAEVRSRVNDEIQKRWGKSINKNNG